MKNRKTIIFFGLFAVLFIGCSLGSVNAQGLLQKAKSGNVKSMVSLAGQYYSGIGMLQSYKDAFVWYKQAADKGNVEAMYKTAYMYENGLGVTKNLVSAFNYYEKSAERGNEQGQLRVAMMHDEGIGTYKSTARAMIWYRVCAQRGEKYALRRMGDFYFEGDLVEKNLIEAKYWYEKAVSQQDTHSMAYLAYILSASSSVRPNYDSALMLIKIPLQQRDAMAQYAYANMLEHGYGVKKDLKKANEYYTLSAEQGFYLAKEMAAIDKYNRTGSIDGFLGVDVKSLIRSESWLIMAKEYEKGEQLPKNTSVAREYYKKAAEMGNAEAINTLSHIDGKKIK